MKCPFCGSDAHKVVDKRMVSGSGEIRRRRECLKCSKRFTTYEKIAGLHLIVIKKDGRREVFDREKLRAGIAKALEKRPFDDQVDIITNKVESNLRKKGKEAVRSKIIGKMVLVNLKKVDMIAYLRFASVYRRFASPEDFEKEIQNINE